jgi:anti-anti-sigma factor
MTLAQSWKNTKFTVERNQGKTPGTIIFRFSGPFTARDMYSHLSPDAFRNIFESPNDTEQPAVHILDLSEVPYIDSRGLGLLVSHHVHCQRNGIRMMVAGASPRVLQLFQLTNVASLFPMIPTVQESDEP